jgi:asparaginyl-tRNA synthetase
MTTTDILALEQVFVDEINGSDESVSGSKSAPYKTPLHAVIQVGGTDQAVFMIKKEGSTEYTEIAKSAAKKLQKSLDKIRKNEAKAASTAASSVTAKGEDVEEEIVEDTSLPKAQKIKIRQAKNTRGTRVVVRGWVATIRVQSRKLVFVYVRDGSDDELQCVLTGKLVRGFSDNSNYRLKLGQFRNFLSKLLLPFMEWFLRYFFSLCI